MLASPKAMRNLALFFVLLAWNAHAGAGSDPAWLALLHYDGARSNAVPGQSFFLSPQGHEDPEAEYAATVAFFHKTPEEASCRFPARALYLRKQGIDTPEPRCERFQKWRGAMQPRGLELVFAAAFINSPSSMYGHTFLKFPRAGKTEGHELLDYTLNFGADTGNAGGLAYVWLGLTGGFPGYFSTAPFYLKVKEYNFVENRDFWVYPVRLTEEELELLARHAWELREVSFPYFFLRKNCSYFLLEFLEVARPGEKLTQDFPLWAVPLDTIRRLKERGILGEGSYRPSRYRLTEERKARLHSHEIELVKKILDGEEVALPRGREAAVLDTAYEFHRYRSEGKGEDSSLEKKILALRRISSDPVETFSFQETPPEEGHPTSRVSLSGGATRDHAFGELSYRGTLHDLLSDPTGYESFSELTMGDFRLRWEDERLFLDRFDLLRLRSLSPWAMLVPKTAWSFRVGAQRRKEMDCRAWNCLAGQLGGGAGLSGRFGPLLAFLLLETDVEAGAPFEKNFRWTGGPTAGLWAPLWKGARALAEADFRWRLAGERRTPRSYRLGLAQSFGRRSEIRVQGEKNRGHREAQAGYFYYF